MLWKWCHRLLLGPPLPRTPGARMARVKQTPQISGFGVVDSDAIHGNSKPWVREPWPLTSIGRCREGLTCMVHSPLSPNTGPLVQDSFQLPAWLQCESQMRWIGRRSSNRTATVFLQALLLIWYLQGVHKFDYIPHPYWQMPGLLVYIIIYTYICVYICADLNRPI